MGLNHALVLNCIQDTWL